MTLLKNAYPTLKPTWLHLHPHTQRLRTSVLITHTALYCSCPKRSPLPKYSEFGKSLCSYKRCWKWCPRASIQAWTRLISFANTFCRSTCEMFLMNAVIAVFNSLSVCGRSRYTADFTAPHRSKCTATFRTHCITTETGLCFSHHSAWYIPDDF
jgi:hypothetical protein